MSDSADATRRPSISAIVGTRGRAHLLADCLTSLLETLDDGDELIVVEAESDEVQEVVAKLPPARAQVRTLHVTRPGKSRQLNRGIEIALGDILLLTDDDVRVPATWAEEMTACFFDDGVGVACGTVRGLTMAPGWDHPQVIPIGEAPFETWTFAHGAAMAVRSTAVREAGGFDERLGPGAPAHGEEHDLVLRIRQRGWRVVIAEATPVVHLAWRTPEENRRNALVYERGGGALVGAAVRRDRHVGGQLLKSRLIYQRSLIAANRRFGLRGLWAFSWGFMYGLRLAERKWLSPS